MFKKQIKQKSQLHLRSSEKKKFISEVRTLFPTLTDADAEVLNACKENLTKIKINTVKEEIVEIYAFDKIPFLFEVPDLGVKLPTVFMCWKFPHIVPQVATEAFVLDKLRNGADLFYPGVVTQGLTSPASNFKANQPVYVNLSKNKAAVAVGISLVNSDDIASDGGDRSGKVVKIYHIVGDCLYKMHPEASVPELGVPDWALPVAESPSETELNGNGGAQDSSHGKPEGDGEEREAAVNGEEAGKTEEEMEKEKANELLEYCFMKALKTVPKTSYPILPATFYANHMLTNLPNGEVLNIKKTKWKKFSVFLQEKYLQGLVKLQQIQKQEYTIAGVESGHRLIREFADPYDTKPNVVEPVAPRSGDKPSVLQVFSVSAATVPFFAKFGLKKHDELTRTDVKVHLNDFIKRENLVHPENPEKVVLDPILGQIFGGETVLGRAELLSKLLDKMLSKYKISSTPNVVHKGEMPYIHFDVCNRTGNKKVTLISNLESYGINVAAFSKELQQKAAASTTIITPNVPDKKGPQIQVQGNQILIAVNILKEKHNINERFMKGLDKALKPKKKGK